MTLANNENFEHLYYEDTGYTDIEKFVIESESYDENDLDFTTTY